MVADRHNRYKYLLPAIVTLFVTLVLACANPPATTSPPVTPSTQPPPAPERQPAEETSPADEVEIIDTAAEAPCPYIKISRINYKGTIYPPDPDKCLCYERVEPDEYVVIKNLSECPQPMGGWVLINLDKRYPRFTFPSHFVLEPGGIVRIYTDDGYLEFQTQQKTDGTSSYYAEPERLWFSFYWGLGDIWDNHQPNTAVLYNDKGEEVCRKSYIPPPEKVEASNK